MVIARFFRHLRLPFQFILAPVFLLGYCLTGASPDFPFLILFLLLHVGIYGGMTAYNSAYDQDEGPIGGMKHPPKAGAWERIGGLGIQILSVVALAFWGWRMALLGLALLLMGVAYSHPRWRWKAYPLGSLLTVTIGQGLLPFFMGVEASAGHLTEVGLWETLFLAGTSALIITGLYPLTQVYQIEEDRKRGDRTFAVRFGPDRVFLLTRLLVGAGLLLLAYILLTGSVFHSFWIWVLPVGYGGFWFAVRAWSQRFRKQTPYQNHDWAFGISLGMSGLLWAFLIAEFVY